MSEATSGSKRKANGDIEHPTQKKPRNRVSFSCAECHRRKQKCDRQMPCSHCVARKIPELCRPYTPGKSDVDLHVRIARLEQIIETALPQYINGDAKFIEDSRDPSSGPEDSKDSKGSSYDREGLKVVRSPFLEQLQHSSLSSVLEDAPPPAARLQSLVLECGFSPHMLSELLNQFPDRNLSQALIDYYFTTINYTRCPLYEPLFRASYESVLLNRHNLQPTDIRFLPLLFVVLALSMRLSPDHIGGNDRVRRLTSLRLYWSSRRALLIASAIQTNSLEIILARLLGARFNIFDRRITESWSEIGAAVRTAQALGLHRDPSNLELDVFQTEYRRRIWAYVYHADRAYAFITGRPKAISDDYSSTRAPQNIDDSLFASSSGSISSQPLSVPTPITFVILRHSLAAIMGRIAHHFQQVHGHEPYSNVLALEDELQNFISSLPSCYALTNPDTSMDGLQSFVPVHRFLLLTEVMFYRIGLHRPYFLRRLDTDTFDRSRQACISSAKHDTEIRRNFYKTASRETIDVCGGMFRAFQSTMICGIALIIDPNREDAAEMRDILDDFLSTTPKTTGHELDVATQRELKIIEFLRNKTAPNDPVNSQPTCVVQGEVPVLPNARPSARPLGFPDSETQESAAVTGEVRPGHVSHNVQRQPFLSDLSPLTTFGSGTVVGQEELLGYPPNDTLSRQAGPSNVLDTWNYHYACMPGLHAPQGSEQWAGGSDIVPDMMVPMFNGENTLPDSEWSYWEALVNHIRVGGPGIP